MTNRGQIAADIHKRMVNDSRFGYSWGERWGATAETWTVDGVKFSIKVGDYDCSSSCITAWKKALTGTKYANALDDATYTGNMREVFVGSGLFTWKPMSFIAHPGDLYLNEERHVAMCQRQLPDELSEFSINENGEVYGGKRGDQTGAEAAVNSYYDYPWDGILHYNGKADTVSTAKPTAASLGFADSTYKVTQKLPVRAARKKASSLCCVMAVGATVKLGAFTINSSGNVWAQITSGDHKGRYVCAKNKDGYRVEKK